MRLSTVLLALLPACGFSSGSGSGGGDGGGTGGDSGGPADATQCFGSYVRVCLSAVPGSAFAVNDQNLDINTDGGGAASPGCDPGVSEYCVVAGTSITVPRGLKLRAHGSRPLVLVSLSSFDLLGDIDVASHVNPLSSGPGADSPACTPGTSPTTIGGGYGGSFGGKGGNGGAGKLAGGGVGTVGIASEPLPDFPKVLRGGCPGGAGNLVGTNGEGNGGSGGGAISIVASEIRLDGKINASGAGGRGASAPLTGDPGGGGGGGSGGMIVLDSPMVSFLSSNVQIWANGGGGAQGGAVAAAGTNGSESAAPDRGAIASNGSGSGGNGGAGSLGAKATGTDGGTDARTGGGGGGGGGGAGFTHVNGTTDLSVVSPLSSPLPAS